jgi:HlyD family secretion protein
LDEAQVELARTTIRAPIDGVVIGRDVDLGQTVAASLEAPTLFTIAQDLRRMEVHASIDEADIGRVRRDQHVTFTVDAYPQRSFEGSVVQIRKAPQVIQNVVVYTVVISAENPDLLLLPGMTATVTVQVSQVADTLRVPNAALRFEPPEGARVGEPRVQPGELSDGLPGFVWVLDGGMPVQVPIRVGAAERTASQVIAGTLSEADQVIVGYSIPDRGSNRFGLRLGF